VRLGVFTLRDQDSSGGDYYNYGGAGPAGGSAGGKRRKELGGKLGTRSQKGAKGVILLVYLAVWVC